MEKYFAFGFIMCYITLFIGDLSHCIFRKYIEKRLTGGKNN